MDIKLPTLLAFERKLETSDALMLSGHWTEIRNTEQWKHIPITKRFNRSTQSAYGIPDAKKSEPNPVSSNADDANLPHDMDTLKVHFTLRIIGNLGEPFACNSPDFEAAIVSKVDEFKDENIGVETLAFRYAYNIANGRFLWRNRVGAEKVKIIVRSGEDLLEFNAYDYSLKDFEKNSTDRALLTLAGIFAKGLNGTDDFVFLNVQAYVKLGNGQHIFPSEEMQMNAKGRVLFRLDNCAAMHNVKIGNAIRTIDNWYDGAGVPIAAEPYGSVTQRGQAYRKTKTDLYTLMLNWLNNKPISENSKAYVVSNLIRGGVFGGKS